MLKQKYSVKINHRKLYEKDALWILSIPLYFLHLTFYILLNKSRKTSGDINFHIKR